MRAALATVSMPEGTTKIDYMRTLGTHLLVVAIRQPVFDTLHYMLGGFQFGPVLAKKLGNEYVGKAIAAAVAWIVDLMLYVGVCYILQISLALHCSHRTLCIEPFESWMIDTVVFQDDAAIDCIRTLAAVARCARVALAIRYWAACHVGLPSDEIASLGRVDANE